MKLEQSTPEAAIEHGTSGFFVLRTPLLPIETYRTWRQMARASDVDEQHLEETVASDRLELRAWLMRLTEEPRIREAILIASPTLHGELDRWRHSPEDKRGRKTERALVRYFLRMTHRCTPFGLFAGCSVGNMDERTDLRLQSPETYRRSPRLDLGVTTDIVDHIVGNPQIRARMTFVPNNGMYPVGDRFRYAEGRRVDGRQVYALSAAVADADVRRVLELSEGGAVLTTLARRLVDEDRATDLDEAHAFVDAMAVHGLLIPRAMPQVTGDDSLQRLEKELTDCSEPSVAGAFARIRRSIDALRSGALGSGLEHHVEIDGALAQLDLPSTPRRTLQVDMFKPVATAQLGPSVTEAMWRGVEVLRKISSPVEDPALARFRRRFVARWEDAEVPLVIALDDELGIWNDEQPRPPLAQGLPLVGSAGPDAPGWDRRHRTLLEALLRTRDSGDTQIDLDTAMVNALDTGDRARLPDAFAVMASIAGRSAADVDEGRFEVLLRAAHGPSGARMLGRFCGGDPQLRKWVEKHLRQEEAARPGAVYAEVAHLPQGRLGNIVVRPVLRDYEIAYLGQSGAPPDRVLPIDDLQVRVVGPRVVVRSRRLDREVVPRLTTAHNFTRRGLGIYRFLCTLQRQDSSPLHFDWGPLGSADFLPRVRHGNVVLSLARWHVGADELAPLVQARTDGDRIRAARRLRRDRSLPREVALHDGDNVLPIDLDNVLVLDALAHLVRNRSHVALHERFGSDDTEVVRGPDGSFTSEVIVPFVRRPKPSLPTRTVAGPVPSHRGQRFVPGTRWLYAKLYTGPATADRLLEEALTPVIRAALDSGAATRWFFVRYADPDWHIRLRLDGDPHRLWKDVVPALHEACAPWLADDRLHRIAFDTYVREATRYGGEVGIELAEDVFFHDSTVVSHMLADTPVDADQRWKLALAGVHAHLQGLNLGPQTRIALLHEWTGALARERAPGADLRPAMGTKFREHRRFVDAVVMREPAEEITRDPAWLARNDALTELRAASDAGRLCRPLHEIAGSLIHMHCNRVLRSDARVQELVIYDLLARGYRSAAARRRSKRKAEATGVAV